MPKSSSSVASPSPGPTLRNLKHIPEIKKYLNSYEKMLIGYDKKIKTLPREIKNTEEKIKKIVRNLEKTPVFTNSGDPFGTPIKNSIKKYNRLHGELSQMQKNKKQKKEDLPTFKRRYNYVNMIRNDLQKRLAHYETQINKTVSPNQIKNLKSELYDFKMTYNSNRNYYKNKINKKFI